MGLSLQNQEQNPERHFHHNPSDRRIWQERVYMSKTDTDRRARIVQSAGLLLALFFFHHRGLESKRACLRRLTMNLNLTEGFLVLLNVILQCVLEELRMLRCGDNASMNLRFRNAGQHPSEINDELGWRVGDDRKIRVHSFSFFFPQLDVDLLLLHLVCHTFSLVPEIAEEPALGCLRFSAGYWPLRSSSAFVKAAAASFCMFRLAYA